MVTHHNLRSEILLEANKIGGVKLWPNAVGVAVNGEIVKTINDKGARYIVVKNPRMIHYGLAKGSSDTIGFKTELIGDIIVPRFMAMEIKIGKDYAKPIQKNFISLVNKCGGIAGVVRSVEDCINLIKKTLTSAHSGF